MSKFLLPTLFALAASAITCPKNWLQDTDLTSDTKCCYGNMIIDDTTAFCCVYDLVASIESATNVITTDDYASWSTAGECFVKVPFTATDYSSRVSSASKALRSGATTTASTVASNEATATGEASTASSVSISGTSSSATSNAAWPVATAHDAVLGGAAVLAGLFVL